MVCDSVVSPGLLFLSPVTERQGLDITLHMAFSQWCSLEDEYLDI